MPSSRKIFALRPSIIIFIVTISAFGQCLGKGVQKSVTTLLDAKWPYSSIVLEASEYFADESAECYWKFVEESAVILSQNLNYTDEDVYKRIVLQYAESYFSNVGVQLLEFSLALHLYSPKLEMFRQIALELKVDCDIGIYYDEEVYCSLSDFKSKFKQGGKLPFTMDNDHDYPGIGNSKTVVILFGDIDNSDFLTFHNYLKSLSQEGKANYYYRPFIKDPKRGKVRLSGYGVELAIKSTEYRAQDDTKVKSDDKVDISNEILDDEIEGFYFNKLKSLHPEKEQDLERFKNHLLDSTNELAKLKVWELQELSLQVSERIKTASPEHVLKELITYSQNFPTLAHSLVKTVVRPDTKKEILHNQRLLMHELNIQPGESGLFINGMQFDVDSIDIFSLFDIIRDEQKIIESLHSLGLQSSQIADLMSMTIQDQSQNFAINFVDSAVNFINDIENDKQYRVWPSSLLDILRPMFPGMLRPVRRNMFHLVIILDPTDAKSYHLVKLAESFYVNRFPLRIGFVFAVDHNKSTEGLNDPGVAMVESFNYVTEEKNAAEALSFITDIYAAVGNADVTVSDVTKQLVKKFPHVDLDSVFGQDSEYDYGRQLAQEFTSRKGISNLPKVLMNGIALSEKSLSMDAFEESVLVEISHCTNSIAKALHKRELQDSDDVVEYLMKQPNVLPRFNNLILKDKHDYLDFTSGKANSGHHSNALREMLLAMPYLSTKSQKVKAHTIWIVSNFSSSKGKDLILSALEHLDESNTAKIGLIFNNGNTGVPDILPLLYYSQYVVKGDRLIKLFKKFFQDSVFQGLLTNPNIIYDHLEGEEVEKLKEIDKSGFSDVLDLHREVCQKLSILSDQWAIVANGMILGPFEADVPTFLPDDFNLIEKLLSAQITDSISAKLKGLEDELDLSYLTASLSSLFLSKPPSKPRIVLPEFKENFSVVKMPSKSFGTPSIDVVAIVDPLSRAAQKLAPLLLNLHEVADCQIKLVLNALEKHSEIPLKNFYRFILEPKLKFQSDGSLAGGPSALFTNLPSSPILTMNLHVPDNWLVEVVRSPYDLDNIHLADVESSVHSEYELEYLLLEGHCFEQSTGNPPRGLQFVLGSSSDPNKFDTIVMANLGYFQLKSNPGSWVLHLREGRSFDIYDITNVDGVNTFQRDTEINVVMDSFKSQIIKLKVNKKPDKQHVELLQDEDEGGLWNSITSSFTGSGKSNQEDADVINIFSLASGHLYERFLRIMMLSVLKNTKHPVKFWFLKNFLSPSFKDFLPKMAQQYKFDFELVQYKWPRWLHQQIEKQRIIWGYKVLFLDVLFPLDVKKIIFVDADQVVRADMKELMDLDLGGAPYGYTPFCDDKKEMDGYRFWKAGYWKSHLQHRKYHISALYVVDLKKFRRIAAGDRLRGQYQGLSQDPNSLSNLDQDLPNNMIHQVAIKSLPQEWLWCETWCDDATKPYAKTIDLCNNPMTKEAKLDAAMRIIDEWTSYDDEIKSLQNNQASEPVTAKSEL